MSQGNVVTGNDKQTNYVLEQGILGKLANLLTHEKKPVRREVNFYFDQIICRLAGRFPTLQQEI